jgi:hypothetical protein
MYTKIKARCLTSGHIRSQHKSVKILAETDRIMAGIEMPLGAPAQ